MSEDGVSVNFFDETSYNDVEDDVDMVELGNMENIENNISKDSGEFYDPLLISSNNLSQIVEKEENKERKTNIDHLKDLMNIIKKWIKTHKLFLVIYPISMMLVIIVGFIWDKGDTPLDYKGWTTLIILNNLINLLVFEIIWAPLVFLSSILILMMFKVITVNEGLAGYGNSSVITIASLDIISLAIKKSTILVFIVKYILGKPSNVFIGLLRLLPPIFIASAFLSNTTIASFMAPAVICWCENIKLPSSKFLLPMGFSISLGGACSIIGASVSLVVISLNSNMTNPPPVTINFFDPLYVAGPVSIIGFVYLCICTKFLSSDNGNISNNFNQNQRDFISSAIIPESSMLISKTLKLAGLTDENLFSILEIQRIDGETLIAPEPESTVLKSNDIIYFSSPYEVIFNVISKIEGIQLQEENQIKKLASTHHARNIMVAVVSNDSRLINHTVKSAKFRERYNAVVIAISRNGHQINKSVSQVNFKAGDSLLLEASTKFNDYYKLHHDFILTRPVYNDISFIEQTNIYYAVLVLLSIIFIAVSSIFDFPLVLSILFTIFVCVISGLVPVRKVFDNIKIKNLVIIANALALGTALIDTGVADNISNSLIKILPGDFGILISVYLTTSILATLISPSSSVSIVFPIAYSLAEQVSYDVKVLVMCVLLAGNCSFAAIWSRTSNIVIAESGGYSSKTFLIVGGLLTLIDTTISVLMLYFLPLYS